MSNKLLSKSHKLHIVSSRFITLLMLVVFFIVNSVYGQSLTSLKTGEHNKDSISSNTESTNQNLNSFILNTKTSCSQSCLTKKSKELKELESKFNKNKDFYKSSSFKEIDARREFIDNLFNILDWKVTINNELEVAPETRMKIGYTTKYADYGFRLDGRAKLYVEAKAISKDIRTDPKYIYQAKRYSWSSTSTDVTILTDYEDFCVYDTRDKPNIEKPDEGKLFCLDYIEYKDNIGLLYSIFSKEAISNGSLERLLERQDRSSNKKGTKQGIGAMDLTRSFLNDFDNYRLVIANNLYKNNRDLTEKELNQYTNDILNMLLFSRVLEDRDIETTGLLREVVERYELGGNISLTGTDPVSYNEKYKPAETLYKELQKEFVLLNKKYRDTVFLNDNRLYDLKIDDKTLENMIEELYPPKSPYNFKAIYWRTA